MAPSAWFRFIQKLKLILVEASMWWVEKIDTKSNLLAIYKKGGNIYGKRQIINTSRCHAKIQY
jgi:hypothetical protein